LKDHGFGSALTRVLTRWRAPLVPLVVSVALVFLIRMRNVSGLLLARGLQRQPRIRVRNALGARPVRILRGVLVEKFFAREPGRCFRRGTRANSWDCSEQ